MRRRVAVTGMSGVTALGSAWDAIESALRAGRSGVVAMPQWDRYAQLRTRLAAPVPDFVPPPHFTRKKTRAMGRVALFAAVSAEAALADAGLLGDPILGSGRAGVAYGSATGATDAMLEFAYLLIDGSMQHVNGTTYLRMMSHSAAVNIGVYFGLKGRVIPTSSACTSGSQALGAAYEAIRAGQQTVMIAGGAEALCPTEAAAFDTLGATSTANAAPGTTPRPFDAARDGLVIGEGAATLILEDWDHARARGARIHAEIVGYATNSDGAHLTQPSEETMAAALALALADAALEPAAIGYVNAHATATEAGDIAESHAMRAALGRALPVSSVKGHLGHTLGACGAIEAWWTIEMLKRGWFAPTLNLRDPDPRCAQLDYLMNEGRALECEYAMSNNFAFGGINTSLIFRRVA
jgi:3-oxoacyl-[acyl-carrier-protein] synthase II